MVLKTNHRFCISTSLTISALIFQMKYVEVKLITKENIYITNYSLHDIFAFIPFVQEPLILFCNLDDLMTSLLCLLHYNICQFCNTCRKKSFTGFNATIFISCDNMSGIVMGLLPAKVTFSEGIFKKWCITTTDKEILFRIVFSLKRYFGDQCLSKATVFRWFQQFMSGI